MPKARKRPCTICRRWFLPNPRVGARQKACGQPECQSARRQKSQASWRRRNPEYATAYRIQQRAAAEPPPEPLRMPAPLNQLPWDLAKDQFGGQGADFIGVLGALLIRTAKDQFQAYVVDVTRLPGALPLPPKKTSSRLSHTESRADRNAIGVSPTQPALGTPASARAAPSAPTAGLVG